MNETETVMMFGRDLMLLRRALHRRGTLRLHLQVHVADFSYTKINLVFNSPHIEWNVSMTSAYTAA